MQSKTVRRTTSTTRWRRIAVAAMALGVGASGCSRRGGPTEAPSGPVSEAQAQRYISKAIRSSNEGVILLPSKTADRVYEHDRLNAIAQEIRRPAAACFVNRAIETIKRIETADGIEYRDVPDGQVRIRTRLAPDGTVLRTEVLETGFRDRAIEPCLQQAIEARKWPQNKSGNTQYVDVLYWVGLGAQQPSTAAELRTHLRKEQVVAGLRATQCLRGRVSPGSYEVEGLNLMDREGETLVNRVEPSSLPAEVEACIAQALRKIRIPREGTAFVRPVSPIVEFRVEPSGDIRVHDEEWYDLIVREERARREAKREQLDGRVVDKETSEGAAARAAATGAAAVESASPTADNGPTDEDSPPESMLPTAPAPAPAAPNRPPRMDPSRGGLKLNLRGHRNE